ncbi:hypothetical protein [Pseudoalteromonas viridis]|nr:hypothetical protein [Pseudoalteromonas viridis]
MVQIAGFQDGLLVVPGSLAGMTALYVDAVHITGFLNSLPVVPS